MPRRRSVEPAPLPPFKADPTSSVALYLQVANHIVEALENGELSPGDRLEGELGLSERFSVSRATMRHAIDQLVERGFLMRKHGVGTQVAPRGRRRPNGISSLFDEMDRKGLKPTTSVLKFEREPAPDFVADALALEQGTEVQYVERLRFVGEAPFGIMRNWLPVGIVELERSVLETQGLYETLRAAGLRIRLAQQSVGAEAADAEQAGMLGIDVGAPLLTMYSTAFIDLGQPIEHGRHDYLPSRYRFEITNLER